MLGIFASTFRNATRSEPHQDQSNGRDRWENIKRERAQLLKFFDHPTARG